MFGHEESAITILTFLRIFPQSLGIPYRAEKSPRKTVMHLSLIHTKQWQKGSSINHVDISDLPPPPHFVDYFHSCFGSPKTPST